VRGHCGLSAAAVEDAGVIRAEPQSPLRMHWRSPRRGTLRQTRLVFALHPSPPKTASPGSGQGCPAFRPVGRFSSVAAETSLRKCRPSRLHERLALRRHLGSRTVAQSSPGGQGPRDPPAADRRHPVTTFPRAVFAPLTCLRSRPPTRPFCFETARWAVRAAQACPHWRSALARLRGRTLRVLTLQPT